MFHSNEWKSADIENLIILQRPWVKWQSLTVIDWNFMTRATGNLIAKFSMMQMDVKLQKNKPFITIRI